jgi:hypothetical protein
MPKFTENGVSICLKNNYFQFGNCKEYKILSGRGVKEMDFGWLDTEDDIFWLIELKGYINPNSKNTKFIETDISNSSVIEKKINELLLKSIHSVCMLDNERSKTKNCLITEVNSTSKIKLVHILNIKQEHICHLVAMNDKLESEFEAYKAIFNIAEIFIIDYENAKKELCFVC